MDDIKKKVVNLYNKFFTKQDPQLMLELVKNFASGYVPGGEEAVTLLGKNKSTQEKMEALQTLSNPMLTAAKWGGRIGKAMITAPPRFGESVGRTFGEALGPVIFGEDFEPNTETIFGGQSVQEGRRQAMQQGAGPVVEKVIPATSLIMDALMSKHLPGTAQQSSDFLGNYIKNKGELKTLAESTMKIPPTKEELTKSVFEKPKNAIPVKEQALESAFTKPAKSIVATDPIINMKRNVQIKDIHGNKAVLPAGEAYTPHLTSDNKIILKDGETFVINKNQYQNVKGNALKAEAKDFAPELKGTEETIRGKPTRTELPQNMIAQEYDGRWNIYDRDSGKVFGPSTSSKNESITQFLNEYATTPTKYSQYTLPGGENYREVLIKAPKSPLISDKYRIEKAGASERPYRVRIEGTDQHLRSFKTENEAKLFIEQTQKSGGTFSKKAPEFKSAHWEEPNVISHLRLNDRTTPDGKKVTFMEEMQSDWAREGRAKGYKMEEPALTEAEKIQRMQQFTRGERQTMQEGAPYHPLLKNWQETTIKRGLKDAVDNGSDYFSWTTGEQQQARYNLSKQVENISWNPTFTDEAYKYVHIKPINTSEMTVGIDSKGIVQEILEGGDTSWKGKNIADVIGKGIGQQIIDSPKGVLKGEGLNIGGEWAKNLYDKQVKDIVEKVTGGKVEITKINTTTYKPQDIEPDIFGDYNEIRKGAKSSIEYSDQQSIRLTPEIKAKIKGEAAQLKQPSGQTPIYK